MLKGAWRQGIKTEEAKDQRGNTDLKSVSNRGLVSYVMNGCVLMAQAGLS